jgi:hypothetical protein
MGDNLVPDGSLPLRPVQPAPTHPSPSACQFRISFKGLPTSELRRMFCSDESACVRSGDDRLPVLAAELVAHHVSVIAATGGEPSALAAKGATSAIPIAFVVSGDPLKAGLVASFNRPGGNVTGITLLTSVMEAKRLGLVRELVPNATTIAMLVNPNYPTSEAQVNERAAFHSIASSASASNLSGTSSTSALAAFRLMTNSNLVGCITGTPQAFPARFPVFQRLPLR